MQRASCFQRPQRGISVSRLHSVNIIAEISNYRSHSARSTYNVSKINAADMELRQDWQIGNGKCCRLNRTLYSEHIISSMLFLALFGICNRGASLTVSNITRKQTSDGRKCFYNETFFYQLGANRIKPFEQMQIGLHKQEVVAFRCKFSIIRNRPTIRIKHIFLFVIAR